MLIIKDHQVLLMKASNTSGDGTWSLPGGGLGHEELLEGCAISTAQNETRVIISQITFLAVNNDVVEALFLCSQTPGNSSHPAFFPSPLTAKLTAKPVDINGFQWMAVDIRLPCGAGGRHWWTVKNK